MLGLIYRHSGEARRLLDVGGAGYRSPNLSGGEEWSGLFNLTAESDAAPVAAAASWPLSAQTVEVRALLRSNPCDTHVMARLIRELADASRAHGAERLIAATPGKALLYEAGFQAHQNGWLTLYL